MLRTCQQCATEFGGGANALYCPSCKQIRKREQAKALRHRVNPDARYNGSEDLCLICGKPYTVNSSQQRYCTDCIPRVAGDMSDDPTINLISAMYMAGYQMTSIARKTGVSQWKVRRVLIHYGLYGNETTKEIQRRLSAGQTAAEIAAELGVSPKTVNALMPYKGNAYKLEHPSSTAVYIRRHRNNHKED